MSNNSSVESSKHPYLRYNTWEETKPWEKGNYSPEGVAYWEEFLRLLKNDALKKGKIHYDKRNKQI